MIPRIDVGYSAMVAALSGLVLLAANYFLLGNPVGLATLPTLVVVVAMGLVEWAVPTMKEIAGTVAGALIILAEAYLSSRTGDAIDTGSVTAAITFLINVFFLWILPRIRVVVARSRTGSPGAVEVTRDLA